MYITCFGNCPSPSLALVVSGGVLVGVVGVAVVVGLVTHTVSVKSMLYTLLPIPT